MGHSQHGGHRGSEPTPLRPASTPSQQDSSGGPSGGDLGNALAVLRGRVDEEFRIAERLDTKGRQAFALAAAVFAVVQTVTFGAFAQHIINPAERIGMLLAAVIAGACLVVAAHRVRNGEELRPEDDIRPDAIVEWCNEAPDDDPEYVSVRLVSELSVVAQARSDSNRKRRSNYAEIESAVRLGLIFAGVELLAAIVVRI